MNPPRNTLAARSASWAGGAQQLIAPVDRRTERLLPIGKVSQPPLADRQRSGKLFVDLRHGQQVTPGRGKLDGQGQAVQGAADLCHRPIVIFVQVQVGVGGEGSVDEQLDRRALGDLLLGPPGGQLERLDHEQSLTPNPQSAPARDHHPQPGRRLEQLGDQYGCRKQMFEVVDDQQQIPVAQIAPEAVGARRLGARALAERGGDLRCDQGRPGQPLEPHEHGTISVAGLEGGARARARDASFPRLRLRST